MIGFCSTCHHCFIAEALRTFLGNSNGTEFCHDATRMENGDYGKTQYSVVLLFCSYASSKFADRRTETMDEYTNGNRQVRGKDLLCSGMYKEDL
jgi:hypothetical protein